jgi:hypothetical protein
MAGRQFAWRFLEKLPDGAIPIEVNAVRLPNQNAGRQDSVGFEIRGRTQRYTVNGKFDRSKLCWWALHPDPDLAKTQHYVIWRTNIPPM